MFAETEWSEPRTVFRFSGSCAKINGDRTLILIEESAEHSCPHFVSRNVNSIASLPQSITAGQALLRDHINPFWSVTYVGELAQLPGDAPLIRKPPGLKKLIKVDRQDRPNLSSIEIEEDESELQYFAFFRVGDTVAITLQHLAHADIDTKIVSFKIVNSASMVDSRMAARKACRDQQAAGPACGARKIVDRYSRLFTSEGEELQVSIKPLK